MISYHNKIHFFKDQNENKLSFQILMEKARSLMPSLPHSSHIVNQALRGRKLDELSTNELSQILNDIELLVRELSEELVNDLVKYFHLK